jgi:transposase
MGQRRRFTPAFKRHAVELLNAGQQPAAEIARELGIPRNRLYKWQKVVAVHGGLPWVLAPSRTRRGIGAPHARVGAGDRGARHFKNSGEVLRAGVHVKYAFIRAHERTHRAHPARCVDTPTESPATMIVLCSV